jgi:TRAP transporter TAXI family solute receptor
MVVESGRDGSVRGVDAILRDTRLLLANERADDPVPVGQSIVLQELESAVRRIDLALARTSGKLTLGSGAPSGTYFEFGEALAHVAEQKGVALFSAESQAAALDFALVQSDVLQLLYRGLQEQYFFPSRDLRAVASLWPEAVHLVTLERTGIREMGDLLGKRIAIGQRGSGSRANALLIGMAARLSAEQVPLVREIGLKDAIEQLEAGDIDALFLTAAVPALAIQSLAARRDDVRFVPVPPALVSNLDDSHYAYYPLTVAERTYPGQKEAFTTLGLTAALVTHAQVPDERVETMLDLLLSSGDELARRYYRAAFISRETMRLGLAVPLHPAAERYYGRYDQTASPAMRGARLDAPPSVPKGATVVDGGPGRFQD